MELMFTETNDRFNCFKCSENTKKLRRCRENRFDFTEKDGNIWPMYINDTRHLFSFCPGKATWDHEAVERFNILLLTAETGQMLVAGGMIDQPEWFIDNASWFVPKYDSIKFSNRMSMIFGSNKENKKTVVKNGSNKR